MTYELAIAPTKSFTDFIPSLPTAYELDFKDHSRSNMQDESWPVTGCDASSSRTFSADISLLTTKLKLYVIYAEALSATWGGVECLRGGREPVVFASTLPESTTALESEISSGVSALGRWRTHFVLPHALDRKQSDQKAKARALVARLLREKVDDAKADEDFDQTLLRLDQARSGPRYLFK